MSSNKNRLKPLELIIIGGPARCGKTTLAKRLASNERYFGFSEDALMHILLDQVLPSSYEGRKQAYKDYLERPRYLDKKKKTTSCPKDAFSSEECELMMEMVIESDAKTLGDLIIDVSLAVGLKQKKQGVFFSDIHIEFFAQRIWENNRDAQLLILTRDPISAIAASLYWQTFPQRTIRWRRDLIYRLLLWCVSAEIGQKLLDQYPEKTYVENLRNDTLKTYSYLKENAPEVVLDDDGWFFDYDPKKEKFRTPDGLWVKMLNEFECRLISHLSSCWQQDFMQLKPMSKPPFVWRCLFTEEIFSSVVRWVSCKPIERHRMVRAILFPLQTSKIFLRLFACKIKRWLGKH